MTKLKKSSGLTPSEQILADLCEHSFLDIWSFPNLANDSGLSKNGTGKELCDLLVVFGNDIIIFSDKSCAYPHTGSPRLDWQRWYRRSIADSAKQIRGAERWIRTYPDRIYLDRSCKQKIPLALPEASAMHIHRICIGLGANERLQQATGARSLAISPTVDGDAETFAVGRVTNSETWIHVLDEQSLYTLLRELSTVSDFVEYLRAKEDLIQSDHLLRAESESDLLAYFLWHGRNFASPSAQLLIDGSLWDRFTSNPHYQTRQEEDEISYFWDGLITYFNKQYVNEQLEIGNDIEVGDYEPSIRIMAGESRFDRRVLSKAILERAERAKDSYIGSILQSRRPEIGYVLLIGPGSSKEEHAEYRKHRSAQLVLRCHVAKFVQPQWQHIVGIALDARGVKGSSEDLVFMDVSNWGSEEFSRAEKMQQDLGYFLPGKRLETRVQETEYPQA